MNEFDVTASLDGVDFAPASETIEVLQNVRTILATRRGSVPLDRGFGVSWEFVDKPVPVARARMAQDVIEAIARYEPRAEVVRVDFDGSDALDGHLVPTVRIRLNV